MIRGTLFKPSQPLSPVLSTGIPLISATIKVPRLSVENSIVLFADTGADRTSLHLRDAVRIFGLRKYRQLTNPTDVKGVGGPAEYYVEPALIVFKHEDGKPEGFGFDLQIEQNHLRAPLPNSEAKCIRGMTILQSWVRESLLCRKRPCAS